MEQSSGPSAEQMIGKFLKVSGELSSRVRLEILCALSRGPMCVSEMSDRLELGVSLVSGHLAKLALLELVHHNPVGKSHVFRLGESVRHAGIDKGLELTFGSGPETEMSVRFLGSVLQRLMEPRAARRMVDPPEIVIPSALGVKAPVPTPPAQRPRATPLPIHAPPTAPPVPTARQTAAEPPAGPAGGGAHFSEDMSEWYA